MILRSASFLSAISALSFSAFLISALESAASLGREGMAPGEWLGEPDPPPEPLPRPGGFFPRYLMYF